MESIKETSRKEYLSRINKVIEYIEDNLSGDLSLEKLSSVSCFSPFHFHRVFHAFIGETPNDFVARIRVEKAAVQLNYNPDETVTEIAFKCGFSSSSAFARAFKKRFGCSATDWKDDKTNANKISKIGITESKNGKEQGLDNPYFEDVIKNISQNKEVIKMEIEVKEMPKFHVAYITTYDGYNDNIGIAYEKLCRWAGPRGLFRQDTKFIGIAFDWPDVTPQDKCRYSACMTVPEGTAPEKEINIKDIPAAKCVVSTYSGPKSGISKFYDELFNVYLAENGFLPDDMPAYEIYMNDPKTDPEQKFVMQACIPVKPL